MKNGSIYENDVAIPSMLTNTQNSIESDLGNVAVFKALDHPLGQLFLWLTCKYNQTHLLLMKKVASLQNLFISLLLISRTWYIDPNFSHGKVKNVQLRLFPSTFQVWVLTKRERQSEGERRNRKKRKKISF